MNTNINPCDIELNNTINLTSNFSSNAFNPYQPTRIEYSYPEIMNQLTHGFLIQILMISIVGVLLQLTCLWYISKFQFELPSFSKIDWNNKKIARQKIFCTIVMINFVPSLFLPVIIILYLLGIKF